MRELNIAIAGAGPAGLMAAVCLARDGHAVRIFERFESPRPVGAGLMLQPTGLACLARVGLDAAARAAGAEIASIDGRTRSGRRIFDVSYRDLHPALFGLGIHRAALFKILFDEVARCAVPITSATDIRGSEATPQGRLLLDREGHRHGPFDLVVDATGTRSPIRAAEGEVRVDKAYPYGALWAVLPVPEAWPHRAALAQIYDGAHTMAGILPVGRQPGDQRQLAAMFWSLRRQDMDAWRQAGLPAWKQNVLRVWPAIAPFLEQVERAEDLTFATYADMAMRRRFGVRLAFIGDAGRTTSPQLGQGCNLALIDATMLAGALREGETMPDALAAFAEARRRHSTFYSFASRWLTPFFQSDSRAAGLLRDTTFPLMGRVPYLQREMVRTLAGMKTGLFSHLDPGMWHEAYRLGASSAEAGNSQPR